MSNTHSASGVTCLGCRAKDTLLAEAKEALELQAAAIEDLLQMNERLLAERAGEEPIEGTPV